MKKKPLIILTGPTAVGKTSLSIKLAKELNTEIVSADSMQVYKSMDIGTAKITKEEMEGIPHHLIDIIEPDVNFNVCDFKTEACKAIDSIHKKGKIPLVVGGTGFYIKALLYDTDFDIQEDNTQIRSDLEAELNHMGVDYMHDKLASIDPKSAKTIHKNNTKRVLRAIEYFMLNNKPISEHNEIMNEKESPYNFIYFVLNDTREKLYERIGYRVDQMLKQGLLKEINELQSRGLNNTHTSMQAIGYKEILEYVDNLVSFEDAVENLKKDTRHLAKRQLTWFRNQKEITWINKPDYDYDENKMLKYILEEINEKLI